MSTFLHHSVHIRLRVGVTEEESRDLLERFQKLGEECGGASAGILLWKVDRNLDQRKHVNLVEVAIFRDNGAFQAFREHPKHQELVKVLREIADWDAGDIYIRPQDFNIML